MTLEQAKDQIAKKYNYENWDVWMVLNKKERGDRQHIDVFLSEAAELYAAQFKTDHSGDIQTLINDIDPNQQYTLWHDGGEWIIGIKGKEQDQCKRLAVFISDGVKTELPSDEEIKKMEGAWLIKEVGRGIDRRRSFRARVDSVIEWMKSQPKHPEK